jgi:RHS repeat-associated protein
VNTQTGVVVEEVAYDECGNVMPNTDLGFVPFGYAGGLYDASTKVVRFGSRDYDAKVGRWISKDPIRYQGNSACLYTYAANDPINSRDPSGNRDLWEKTWANFTNANRQIYGFVMPGMIAAFQVMYSGTSPSPENMVAFAVGSYARFLATSEVAALTGSPGVLGFWASGFEGGFAGAAGAAGTWVATWAVVAASFEIGLFIGSFIAAIWD